MPEILELERRRRKAEMLKKTREQRGLNVGRLELRENADDGTLTLVGLACRTGVEYDLGWHREVILANAFRRTLGEDPDVQLVVNHAAGGQLPLARTRSGTMRLSEVDEGLRVEADLDGEDPDVQSLVRKMRRGDVDGMSFAFLVTDDEWNDDFTLRTIRSVSLHRGDVSVVNQGANPAAYATLRGEEAAAALHTRTHAEMLDAFHEMRAGKTLSAATVEILTQALNLASDAEDAAAGAREALDGLINPESDDGEATTVERSITNEKGLCAAIHGALRWWGGTDERRAAIIKRADELGLPGLIPEVWDTPTGAIRCGTDFDDCARVGDDERMEVRETFNDTLFALQEAVEEKFVDNGDYWYVWVQDFTATDVIFYAGGDLWSAPYTLVPGGAVTVGEAVGVRPVTEYVQTGEAEADEPKVAVDELPTDDEYLSMPDLTTRAAQDLDLLRLRGGRR
jgi:HK97 family phage prohead protease